uniref:probable disease resistance protein At4g27220 n=1 Tax=Erigeron canadensis TaxID=72917 RepID=UPI001CB89F95|nr:probable disease resistance protein At4g27220 [Erigeron canadensis]
MAEIGTAVAGKVVDSFYEGEVQELVDISIRKGDKILIILDDVWDELNLENLCIPCGNNYMNCKILLTSRSEKVCQKMNAQSKICVNSLLKEAWILFKRVVGERLETESNLKQVALKVVEECGGLPLLLQAVGNALKNESIKSWNWALTQLQKHAPLDIDEGISKAFTHLKLSYDYLRSEEAKSCFLLCSMFPEDYDIPLEKLVLYGVGLEKFDDLDSIEDARGRVQNTVNSLTSSGLLLKANEEGFTKMHDVVRDVALLIASEVNNKFLVKARQGLTEWLPRHTGLETYKGISLMYNDINKLPDYNVNIQQLELFLVFGNCHLSIISDEFIRCMKKVKVLDISWNDFSSLPQSFLLLTKLHMLDLHGNTSFHDISILGELKDLEILILNKTGITEIPEVISQLLNLRVLQVRECVNLSRITQGVISALWRLEELSIHFKLKFKGAYDCIVEVMSLSKLTYLDVAVPNIDDIPPQFTSENLKGFVIQIGEYIQYTSEWNISRSNCYLFLSTIHLSIPLLKWLKKLIEISRPHIFLSRINSSNSIMSALYDEGFIELEHIELKYCDNVSWLVDNGKRYHNDEGKTEEKLFKELKHLSLSYLRNLEVLWKCPYEYVSLTNLVTLSIDNCHKLERVFPVNVTHGLGNLKKLEIKECFDLKEVIYGGGGGGDDESENVIVFPFLAIIEIEASREFKRFFNAAGNWRIKYPSLVTVGIYDCFSMEIWGLGIHETPKLERLDASCFQATGEEGYLEYFSLTLDGPCAINEAVSSAPWTGFF